MGIASRDANYVPTLIAVSNVDSNTPITLYADPTTHRLLVSSVAASLAAGSDTQVQFNDGGTNLGGDGGMVYNKTTDTLTVSGTVTTAALSVTGTSTTVNVINSGTVSSATLSVTGTSNLVTAIVSGTTTTANLTVTGTSNLVTLINSGTITTTTLSVTGTSNLVTAIVSGTTTTTTLSVTGTSNLVTAIVSGTTTTANLTITGTTNSVTIINSGTVQTATFTATGTSNLVNAIASGTVQSVSLKVTGNSEIGTVTVGTWNGSNIPLANGGTGTNTAVGAFNTIADMAVMASSNQTSNGPHTNDFLTGGTAINVMDLVFLSATSSWVKADSTTIASSVSMLAVALQAGSVGQAIDVALPGSFITNNSWSWTVGTTLFVGTSGAISMNQPTAANTVIRAVGYSGSANMIYFDPSPDWVVHS